MKNVKKGFTLVELLFVMAIIAILAGFAIANLKDSTRVATENSMKNDAKNAITQQQTYFAGNQEYTDLAAANGAWIDANNGMVTSTDGVKFTVSKGNVIETTGNIDCGDSTVGFSVEITNATLPNATTSYNSCTDGTIQNGALV
ncbi:MAG: type II secretion system GspH family protein [Sulfuricurvum sp.]|jgi:prepilin-type N-terminal cleavage/methylation domain-containing protein|uniref:type IV pilin protein n=1 Tax=Sulfuricurvum sp. TaxID=2025608 RepID=UPI0025CE0248|nr:type II secretion system protein [Sulfuricurvum sp.]MCK9372443.1 type II secretion system GspH family protein [Sulfuricurvum sp.]